MVIRGAAIHRDGHGKCGLFPTRGFLHSPAGLTPFPSSYFRRQPPLLSPLSRMRHRVVRFFPAVKAHNERRGL